MNRSSSRWIIGVLAVVVVVALFYGFRHERPKPQPTASQNAPAVATAPAPQPPTAAPASQSASPSRELAATGSNPHDLTPNAAAQAPAVPNFVDLVQTVKPAVVSVRVKSDLAPQITSGEEGTNPFEGTPLEPFFRQFSPPGEWHQGQGIPHRYVQAQGSGFFISAEGHIVTNNHVVANAVQLQIVMDDGKVLDAKVIGTDPKTDLALLKVEGQNAFPFVSLADDLPNIGEWVIAMGNPFGLGGTVTAGIVSARGRDIGSGPYNDFLQIDAAVNRGNSGGPTFNMSGRVIGVNTAIYSPSGGSVGIAFDIPATTVKPVIAQLKERGYVERGWIGVQVQPVTKEIADSIGMKEAEGALIAGTQPDSPAAKAGLKVGDVITALNGAKVKDSRDLARQVAGMAPSTTVEIGYSREGKQETAQVTIAQLKVQHQPPQKREAPAQSGGTSQTSRLGIAVAPAARVMGIGEQGVAVIRVDPSGKGAEAGLQPGDVIVQLGGKEVSSPEEVTRALEAATAQKKQHVLALVRRNDREMFIALPTG
jgi:serine protease Do